MGIMGFLRNKAGIIIVGVIGLSIVAFLVSDAIRLGSPFWNANNNIVGEVSGEKINIQDFSAKVEQNSANTKQQMGGAPLNSQMLAYVVDNTWNQTISDMLLSKEITRLGLEVGKIELNDMLSGKTPHPQVIQAFGDPATGKLNLEQLNAFLSNIEKPENVSMKEQWGNFLISITQDRLSQKYTSLIKNSMYVTNLEAQNEYNLRNKLVNFSYVGLPYNNIPDQQIKLTDEDYETYYKENKYRFNNPEEVRTLEYVVFDASPTSTDSAEISAKITKLSNDFRVSANDSLFVSINSDTKSPIAYVREGQLDPELNVLVFAASKGALVGPVFSNNAYKLAKILDVRLSPDSVTASHILINPTTEGGLDKAKAKADSIKKLIQGGASFSVLAAKYGTDGSKDKGGSLGTFARGTMIPAFEEAVFNGKTGDLKVITTQFGVHIIKVNAQKGSSKVVKVAVVDKAIATSSKTQQLAYGKATDFLSKASNEKSFDALTAKANFKKQVVPDITANQGSIMGLDNPREIIRWAFAAKEGDVSDRIFELNNQFVIAKLATIKYKGILPLSQLKPQLKELVLTDVKAKKLAEKLTTELEKNNSLPQISKKLNSPVVAIQNVVLANPIIPGIGQENKLVGSIFGSQPGKVSKAIIGENAVYAFTVSGFINPAPLVNTFKQKQQIAQYLLQRSSSDAFKALKTSANIKDNRVKFF
ncbi:MAG: SurA N-terminal domain-containing protein [Sphingobacteriaceae bacterium]|nr:SurA N-terminal domain-containing protein [Sphingobacteriaceae bacterium]